MDKVNYFNESFGCFSFVTAEKDAVVASATLADSPVRGFDYDYALVGEPLVASGPLAATFTHQFSTKPYCPVTGFSEYQMRKYRPEIGRWLCRDPIEEIGGDNLYCHADNNGIQLVDYFGESCETFEGTWPLGIASGLFVRTSVCKTTCPEEIEGSLFLHTSGNLQFYEDDSVF